VPARVRGTNGSLNAAGEVTKRRPSTNGARGGKPWTKGAVDKVLANRAYLGEAVHKGVAYPGGHAAIVDQRVWEHAHAVMAEPAHRRGAAARAQMPALLKGLIHGPNGRPMSPSHTRRRNRIYRYYVTPGGDYGRIRQLRGDERTGSRR
jgi:site-specific DNA recombinase